MDSSYADRLIFDIIQTRIDRKSSIQQAATVDDLRKLIDDVSQILSQEPVLLQLEGEVRVVGDIHGNIDDLLRVFEAGGYPPNRKYLFLGDLIDRNEFGVEVVAFLFALKIKFPDQIYIIRGNHELRHISMSYGFFDEVYKKYSCPPLFEDFHAAFQLLPLAAVIDGRIFCVHGGISPSLSSISIFSKMSKPRNIIGGGLFADLVWSDPRDRDEDWSPNNRGCGFYFNSKSLAKFLDHNGLESLIRSHEMCNDGFYYPFKESKRCLTVFSNTDYCGGHNNAGIVRIPAGKDPEIIRIPMLSPEDKLKRRIQIPPWVNHILQSMSMKKEPSDDETLSETDGDLAEIPSQRQILVSVPM